MTRHMEWFSDLVGESGGRTWNEELMGMGMGTGRRVYRVNRAGEASGQNLS